MPFLISNVPVLQLSTAVFTHGLLLCIDNTYTHKKGGMLHVFSLLMVTNQYRKIRDKVSQGSQEEKGRESSETLTRWGPCCLSSSYRSARSAWCA